MPDDDQPKSKQNTVQWSEPMDRKFLKTPSPEEMNLRAAEFWHREGIQFEDRCNKYPHDLVDAAEAATDLIQAGLANNPRFVKRVSLEAEMQRAEMLRRKDNQRRGKQPKRVKAFTAIIQEIVRKNPSINTAGVLDALRAYAGSGVIERIDDAAEEIEWSDEHNPAEVVKFSSIKDYLLAARKKL